MAIRVNQSTIPSFNTENSLISPMVNDTILFCENFNGQRKNFIVVDYASIVIAGEQCSVQTAYDNQWIVEFPVADGSRKDNYVFAFTGNDYNQNQEGFQTGKWFLREKSFFKVYKNGVLLSNSDWDFTTPANGTIFRTVRTQGFLMNTAPVNTDVYIFHYYETINQGGDYKIKLYNQNGYLKPSKITKTLHHVSTFSGWCNWISQTADNEFDVSYTSFDDPTVTANITKRYPTHFRLSDFVEGFDFSTLNLELEVYKSTGRRSKGTFNRRSTGQNKRLVGLYTNNNIPLAGLGSDRLWSGELSFRFHNTIDNTYSDFFTDKIKIKRSPLVVTDASLSSSNTIGFYRSAFIVN